MQSGPFDDLALETLYQRRSIKWTLHPPDVLPAWVAEMDFPLAAPVKAAIRAAVERDDIGYAGLDELPPAFAGYMARRFGWTVDPRCVMLVSDSMAGIRETLRLLTQPGDGVIVNSPVYAPFFGVVPQAERTLIDVPLVRSARGWDLDLAGIERAFAEGARAYLLCSPHNPVGRVFPRADLERVAALAAHYGAVVVVDEIHAPLTLPGAVHTVFAQVAAEARADSVIVTSASKAWNIAGGKCAIIAAGSDPVRARLAALPSHVGYSPGILGVLGSIAAFTEGDAWLERVLAQIDANRRRLTALLGERLPQVRYVEPEASYLAWLDCSALGFAVPSAEFLQRGRVAFMDGRVFGDAARQFVRVNMGTSGPILSDMVERMVRSL